MTSFRRDPYPWFAWRPVFLGALGTGRLAWLRWVMRDDGPWGVVIYQSLSEKEYSQ